MQPSSPIFNIFLSFIIVSLKIIYCHCQQIQQRQGPSKENGIPNTNTPDRETISQNNNADSGAISSGTLGGIAITVMVITLLLVWICMEFMRKSKNGLTKEEIRFFRYGNPEAIRLNVYAHENVDSMPYNSELFEIKREHLYIDKSNILGEGQYGRVFVGRFNEEKVAVKTVKPNVDKLYLKSLLGELKVIIHIGPHENVVNLLGACSQNLRNGELFIVLECCSNGSLEKLLRNCKYFLDEFDHSGHLSKSSKGGIYENRLNPSETPAVTNGDYSNIELESDPNIGLKTRDLIKWCLEIAEAMNYLSSKKVIHGDLATRNVLLDRNRTAKITDFGLSRKLYDYSNYVKKNQEPLPWRWMAIESLRDFSFSPLSDVWAYGITTWEIFSLGSVPYPDQSWTNDFITSLENNLRLHKPKYASDNLYWNLLLECWRLNPDERPTFSTIIRYFKTFDLSSNEK